MAQLVLSRASLEEKVKIQEAIRYETTASRLILFTIYLLVVYVYFSVYFGLRALR